MYTPNLYLCQILFCIFDTTIEIKKPFSLIAKGLGISKLPRQDDYRTFCMSYETEEVYHKLEEIISIG